MTELAERYDDWLEVALEAANAAADVLRSRWRQEHTIHTKGFRDIVTETDVAVERLVMRHLRDAFPDHAITSEEAGAEERTAQVRWVLDPVDGTTNFSRNNPGFSTTLAALDGGRPVVGVIIDPLHDHCFAARLGAGATLNGDPIHTSQASLLANAVFSFDTPRNPARRHAMWAHVSALLPHTRTMRALGSAALNMAYVAAGWTDLYFSLNMHAWDQAAAGLLVQEAGGAVGTVSGAPWTPFQLDPVMAASPALLAAYRTLTNQEA